MVPSGPPTPGGGQSVTPSLLRSNSNILGGQGSGGPSQSGFPSLVSPRNQYNSMNLMGNMANVSSLLNNSFGNGGSNSGLSGSGSLQRGGIDTGAESDPLSNAGNSMNFAPSVSFGQSNSANTNAGGQNQGQQFSNSSGNQLVQDQLQHQQLDLQNFQHGQQSLQQFSIPQTQQQQQQQQQHQLQQHQQQQQQQQQHQQLQQHAQQQQYQSIRGGQGGGGAVKLEPQTSNEQNGPQQQLQSMRTLNQVKLEPQQLQNIRSLPPVKMEHQHSDQSLFLQQQQQQQFLHMSRQSSAAAAQMSMLQQQRILQLQQQQQQQLLKALPQPRSQVQQQFQAQNLPVRTASKPAYEPGMCARRLTHYMYHQQHRPADNNIEFWRKFVAEYFAPHAKKRWCVSLYGSGRQTTGVFPQDVWHCEICNQKPGRGFETTVEVLPRLCKIKYDSGTLEELLYVDMPREYQNASGQIVLDYEKAIQESVFEQLRVVRDGKLRIVFSPDLKICSWEFCARRHEELIPRRLIVPQVGQLGSTAQKYQQAQTSASNSASTVSNQELQNNCNMFVQSTRQLAKALEVPLVNDLGYTKRYVRCLQISEVVNSMKDLIDYSRETGNGPMASLINFPRRTSGIHGHGQQPEEQQPQQQQTIAQNSNNGQATSMQLPSSNGVTGVHNPLNTTSTTTSASTIVGLLHQNSMNSRHESPMNNGTSLYGGTTIQIPSASSSSSLPQSQANPSSPFASPTPSTSNNIPQTLPVAASGTPHLSSANSPANMSIQQPTQSNEAAEQNDSQSSVQQILQEMMMSSQLNGGGSMIGLGSLGNDMKNINGMTGNATAVNGGLVGNGMTNNSAGMSSVGFGNMGGGIGVGMRGTMGTNSTTLNGRVGMGSMQQDISMSHQQQELGNRLLNGLGAVNGFNNHQFD